MSILSDKEIKELCVCPTTYFDLAGWLEEIKKPHAVPSTEHAAKNYWDNLQAQYNKPITDEQRAAFQPMISPFVDGSVRQVSAGGDDIDAPETTSVSRKVMSYGTSSYGYDVRLDSQFKVFTNINSSIIDPKRISEKCLVDIEVQRDDDNNEYVILPPNSYLLGVTVEYIHMPRDVLAICMGKSTYARAGVIVNVTPIEPGFRGQVVLEISNATSLPVKIYANEGIAQFVFFKGNPCEVSYADKGGKYQDQRGIALGRM